MAITNLNNFADRFEPFQAATSIGTWEFWPHTNHLAWDQQNYLLHNTTPQDFDNTLEAWLQYIHADDRKLVSNTIDQAIANLLSHIDIQFRVQNQDHVIRIIELHAMVLQDVDAPNSLRITGINIDITKRLHAEENLQLAINIFQHTNDSIIITDEKQRILDVNPKFVELTGYKKSEVIGQTPRIFRSHIHNKAFYANMWHIIEQQGYWRGEIWNRHRNGGLYAELLTISKVQNLNSKITNYIGLLSDLTVIKQQQWELDRISYYDSITQLPNRVVLAPRMQQAMAYTKQVDQLLAVCCLDLDNFKPINDKYGHDIGDKLLFQVGERLRNCLSSDDSVSRSGGDEFVLLLEGLKDIHSCEGMLARVLHRMRMKYVIADYEITLSASIGVTLFPADDVEADVLLRHADQAMYQAKEAGRNCYKIFDLAQDRETQACQEIFIQLESALKKREFLLYYQPKVDMRHGLVLGSEALIRWKHPQRGLLSPGAFLPKVERTSFIIHLGDWVLEEALRQLTVWDAAGFITKISVNISGQHLQQKGFVQHLQKLLSKYSKIMPSQLELEVLETTALDDLDHASDIINKCRSLGVSVAIDDFGTGYSSLIYLKRLPADILKIDQSFVRGMVRDSEDRAIVDGIIGLSHAMHRNIIAEGVETEEHGIMLLNMGCDLGQGYGIARPMPATEFPEWANTYKPFPSWFQLNQCDLEHQAT